MLQSHYSLFDSFFAPTRVLVVSEERLQQAEREARQNQLDAIDARIDELTKYRTSLYKQLNAGTKHGKDLDQLDLTPSDSQPPGVDRDPQSLEEALTGECDV
jgi:hypothetical protein